MESLSIDDVQVRDKTAWEAALAKLSEQREVHPVDRSITQMGLAKPLLRSLSALP